MKERLARLNFMHHLEKPESMKTMKAKAKLKKNIGKFGKVKVSNAETSTECTDYSQLRIPIDINLSSLKQVAQLFEKGTQEIQSMLTYDCDIIYECRICRSLFRSLANFISHKRVYCLEKYNVTSGNRSLDPTWPIYDQNLIAATGALLDPEYKEHNANERILRSQSTKKPSKKDLTSVVEMLTKKQNDDSDCGITLEGQQNNSQLCIASDNEQVLLEILDSNQAAYQTVLKPEIPVATDLMMSQTLELKNLLNRNTAVLGPDGQLLKVSNVAEDNTRHGNDEDTEVNINSTSNGHLACTLCNIKFSTKKTLAFHIKSKHMNQMCYPCPCCMSTFANRWSVYRHLFKVHRKTNDQVRRLRAQIQGRACKKDSLKLDKMQKERGPTIIADELITKETQEWMQNLELDAELQRCSACGRRFERKAALASHSLICQKKAAEARQEGVGKTNRASKNPPQRITEVVPKTMPPVDNDDMANALSEENAASNIVMKECKITEEEPSAVLESNAFSVTPEEQIETSIRVEDVASLSKDMWDKIESAEHVADESSPLGSADNSSPVQPSQSLLMINEQTEATTPISEISDVPEVIYTSIDNSRPVPLSVLDADKKLGIQYRGIRLPTVTLEKINVSRIGSNSPSSEPNVSVNAPNSEIVSLDEPLRQPLQFRKLQCPPCNRRFMSMANLRRHMAIHMRRNRYRCTICDFGSLLKCDTIAHCNKKHNAKNNRTVLADMIIEMPLNMNMSEDDDNPINAIEEATDELEVIDVSCETPKIPTGHKPRVVESTISPAKVMRNDEGTLSAMRPKIMSVGAVKLKRGRPLNSTKKNRRGPKSKKKVQKVAIGRHVSPPTLPKGSIDEISGISESTTHNNKSLISKDNHFSHLRAPSRLDSDPELRKMVMEVIFGSVEVDGRIESKDGDNNLLKHDQEKHKYPVSESIRSNIFDPENNPEILKVQPKPAKMSNNNSYIEHYKKCALKPMVDHGDVIYPRSSDYVTMKVLSASPIIEWENTETLSVSPGEDRLMNEDDCISEELTETEMIFSLPNEF